MNRFRFLTMSILSLIIAGLAGCKEDDDSVVVTAITVTPASITDIVVGGAEITLKAEPAGAAATFSWSASPADKVSITPAAGAAEVTVKGLIAGSTVITVSSGEITKTVDVTVVNPLTDFALLKTETTLVVEGSETIAAVHVPLDAPGITYTATSSSAGIVEASAVGSGIVLKGKSTGKASVTVTYGGISKTINVTVIPAVYKDVLGYWEFENSANFGAAMYGADLEVIDASAFSQVDGPAAGNKAIQGVATVPDLKLSVQGVTAYTIVWDVKIPIPEEYDQWGSYFTGFWNGTYMTSGNSSIFFVYRHAEYDGPKLDIGGGAGLGYSKLAIYEANPPWLRVVITVDRSAGSRKTYCNGVLVVEPEGNVLNIDERLDISNAFYFARNPKNAGTDAVPHPISAIAVWSKVLTDREIAALGGL